MAREGWEPTNVTGVTKPGDTRDVTHDTVNVSDAFRRSARSRGTMQSSPLNGHSESANGPGAGEIGLRATTARQADAIAQLTDGRHRQTENGSITSPRQM